MQKIIFTVKKIHKNCCKHICLFWLRYQPNRSAASASPQTPLGELTAPLPAVFRGPILLREGSRGVATGGMSVYIPIPPKKKSVYLTLFFVVTGCFFLFDPGHIVVDFEIGMTS